MPGNRVDVLATKRSDGSSNDSESRTILQDLRVLAVDQTAGTDKTQPVVVRAVTLEMSAKEAEVLVKAQSEGKLQLALRNPLDAQKQPQAVAAAAPVQAAPPVAKPQPKPVAKGNGGVGAVTIIRGTEVEVAKARF